jgi:hypothetical protein
MSLEAKTPESIEAPALTKECFDAYREGNLRLPQGGTGILTLTADAVLSDERLTPTNFEKMRWNKDQLREMFRDVERAHAAWGIPVRPSEQRLAELWRDFQVDTLQFMCAIAGVELQQDRAQEKAYLLEHSAHSLVAHLEKAFEDTAVREEVKQTVHFFASRLRSPEYADLQREIREAAADPRNGSRTNLFTELKDRLIRDFKAQGGTFRKPWIEPVLREIC